MPLTKQPLHIFEPNPLACGQAVLAMLSDKNVQEIIDIVGTDRETTLSQMKKTLSLLGIEYEENRVQVKDLNELPNVALLSLETPKCWHWSLYFNGKFYDPEYGVLDDFPPSNRRYFWKISSELL